MKIYQRSRTNISPIDECDANWQLRLGNCKWRGDTKSTESNVIPRYLNITDELAAKKMLTGD